MSGRKPGIGPAGETRADGPFLEAGLGRILLAATLLAAALLTLAVLWPAGPADVAGVAVLLSAPFVVIVAAGVLYGRAGQWRLAATSLLLLAILTVGLLYQAAG